MNRSTENNASNSKPTRRTAGRSESETVRLDKLEEQAFYTDCPTSSFTPTILPAVQRIVAIGDIHGDLTLAIESFKLADLIDDNLNWIARPPDTVVVQVGDQIDNCRTGSCKSKSGSGADDMKVMEFFDRMDKAARACGGAVYSLLGNHELMNVQGKFNYVSYDNMKDFEYDDKLTGTIYRGAQGRELAFRPGGPVARNMACSRQSVLIIGSTLFVHAGILPELASSLSVLRINDRDKLRYLNTIVRRWLLNKVEPNHRHDLNLILNNQKLSPFWVRIYGSIPANMPMESPMCDSYVKEALEVYKIGQMVVGHTPQMFTNNDGINGTCYVKQENSKLFRIDGGFSSAFQVFDKHISGAQVLEIIGDKTFNLVRSESSQT